MMKYNSKIFARSICAVMAGECALKNKMGIRQR